MVHVDRPDFDTIRDAAGKAVSDELGRITDPVKKLHRAADIIAAIDREIDGEAGTAGVRAARDAAALSLWAYSYVRGIEQSMGVRKNAWVKTRRAALGLTPEQQEPAADARPKAARAAHIAVVPDAAEQLPKLAVRMEAARARRATAVQFRNAAVRVLRAAPYSWTQEQVAAVIGTDPSMVSHIERAAE
jgi:hypothetical protein